MDKAILNGDMRCKNGRLDQEVFGTRWQFIAKAKEKAQENAKPQVKKQVGRKLCGQPKRTGIHKELSFCTI